jgi:hypothetical protein
MIEYSLHMLETLIESVTLVRYPRSEERAHDGQNNYFMLTC